MRPRMSRIYWRGKFLDYPLNGTDVIKKLGPVELTRCRLSYLWAAIKPKGREDNLEQWVSNRFGKRLYQHFFKSYTEKVWGVPDHRDARRVGRPADQGPVASSRAAKAAFFGNKGNKIKSLIDEFHYPRYGPGQMWETMTDEIIGRSAARCGSTRPVTQARGPRRHGRRARAPAASASSRAHVISSLPLRATVGMAGAAAPGAVQAAAQGLRYRDFLTVVAGHRRRGPVPRQLDLHPRARRRGRPHPELPLLEPVDGPGPVQGLRRHGVLLLQGRRAVGDRPTTTSSSSAKRELEQLGLAKAAKVERGFVMRVPKAYPMYDADYAERVDGDPRLARRASTTCSRSAATACTATTTPTTRC